MTPTTKAGAHLASIFPLYEKRILAIEAEARTRALDEALAAGTDEDALGRLFIRIRGAHNPTGEIEPCAWCRLAAEQAVEAFRLRLGALRDGSAPPEPRPTLSLAEVRDGTGFPPGTRFIQVSPEPRDAG